jgi:hypothetical protein
MHIAGKWHLAGNGLLPAACLLAVSVGAAVVINAQTKAGSGQTSHSPAIPGWQAAAGGKMSFEVASVKPSLPDTWGPPSFPLGSGDAFTDLGSGDPPRGRFTADFPLPIYIEFAYKISPAPEQRKSMFAHLPKWVETDGFVIHARARQSD